MDNQSIIFLLLFSLIMLLFAVLTDKSEGLFLARNPFDKHGYEENKRTSVERRLAAYLLNGLIVW